jgi:hypothetical protein
MKILLLAIFIVIFLASAFIIGINFKHLKKHGCEGALAIPSGVLFFLIWTTLSGIALISLLSYVNEL